MRTSPRRDQAGKACETIRVVGEMLGGPFNISCAAALPEPRDGAVHNAPHRTTVGLRHQFGPVTAAGHRTGAIRGRTWAERAQSDAGP